MEFTSEDFENAQENVETAFAILTNTFENFDLDEVDWLDYDPITGEIG